MTEEVCQCILFLHALTGCDTTSRINGLGKGQAFKKVKANPTFFKTISASFLMNSPIPSKELLSSKGEEALACFFGAQPCEGLDLLIFRKFVTKTSRAKEHVQVNSLPPTYAATTYLIFRVYHQIQQWIGNDLEPTDWGRQLKNDTLVPIKTHLHPPAPEDLLKIIRCNCKQNCESKVAIVSDMVLPVPFVVVNVVELISLILPLVRFWTMTELLFMNFKNFTEL